MKLAKSIRSIFGLFVAMPLIVSTLCVFDGTCLAQDQGWGSLKGQIIFSGKYEAPEKIVPSKADDKKYCEANGIELVKEDFVVDKSTMGIQGAFVMMYHGRKPEAGAKVPVHDSYKEMMKKPVIVDNAKLRFAPHDVMVMVGQDVILRNSDDVGHNVRLGAGPNAFNSNVPAKTDVSVKDKITEAERLPQTLECNMHDWMKGKILIRHEPYNTTTGEDGTFEIKNIPAGKYEFQFWHTKYMKLDDESGKTVTGKRGVIEVEIKDGETLDLGKLFLKKKP